MLVFKYRVFGLNIQCPFECPLLQPTTAIPDIIVEFGQILAGDEALPSRFLLNITNIARYLIENGNKITIEADPAAPLNEIQLFLFGSAMGGLLHQRQLLVLHGCAIEFAQGVVVFVAESGTGKSTLASLFHHQGFRVFCDDQSVIDVNNGLLIEPGLGQIKLWQDAMEEQGLEKTNLKKVYRDHEKYIIPIPQGGLMPKPLIGVIELQVAKQYDFSPLKGKAKMELLINHTYRNHYLAGMGLLKQHFLLYDKVASSIFMAKATRPKKTVSSRDFFELILQQLELHGIHATAQCVESHE